MICSASSNTSSTTCCGVTRTDAEDDIATNLLLMSGDGDHHAFYEFKFGAGEHLVYAFS